MTKTCMACKRQLPVTDFCKNKNSPTGINSICLKCDRDRHKTVLTSELERKVRIAFDGHCAICDTVENLEVVPIIQVKRRVPKAYILLCSHCKAQGIPQTSPYLRDCAKCGHRWVVRKQNTITCPKCKSPYWHVPRR